MASWEDVRRIALALPETAEEPSYGGAPAWKVRGKAFAWERPLRKADLEALGDGAPSGPILGARVEHLGAKEALVDAGAPYFTTPHFDGYPAILVELDRIDDEELTELLVEGWLDRAPKRVARAWLDEHPA